MSMNLFDAVVDVESAGKPTATSIAGARGLMQITQPALTDYNRVVGTELSMDDMYDPSTNMKVGKWYLSVRIPQMLRAFKVPNTLDNRLWAYNAGIGRVVEGVMPTETKGYIGKVKSRMGR